jgi:predicted phosphodiesterase
MSMLETHHEMSINPPVINTESNRPKGSFVSRAIAQLILHLRPATAAARPSIEDPIQIVCISDTHNATPDLAAGDVLIHGGDLSQHGTFDEIQVQLDWMKKQPHAHKIVIGGNHDLLLDAEFVKSYPDHELAAPGKSARDLDWGDLIYLEDETLELTIRNRKVKLFASPYIPYCAVYAFQYDPEEDFWDRRIPDDVDIVVTHGPPALHMDRDEGCPFLLKELWRVQPPLVVFGHMHHLRGQEVLARSQSQQLYEAIASGLSSWFSLPRLLWLVLQERIWPPAHVGEMHLVNAACFKGEDRTVVTF